MLPGEDKRLDGLTLVPWQGGRCLASDVTVNTQTTDSVAQAAVEGKVSKYIGLPASHLFVPIAFDVLGPINEAGHSFLSELGLKYLY